ncbi:hypothetical protein I3760_05G104000 [Carya illinoinensis]|uniref:Uncharacterized protein n=1 Tax=Carya illinoinensis TaxID=32201 RepID=A0A922JPI4_CARIL|nr:uncharacterized protein LOC122308818 isoform X4 [Carya illinoinensis]KAG2706441.1 hypothetical protein I3760_05G104000 [Carya illinoinensis]KAG6712372.1 hypothetical protein I3842_05G100000 [Carya illinoinensis]
MVERFFSVRQVELLDHNHSDPIMLLSGPPSCGKTSLLFQFAFNSAAGSNHEVVFICNRRKLESKPPYFSPGIDPSSDTFQRIQMKYVDEDEGIKNYFAAFHLHDTFPAAVVIDDFGDFFEERSCQEKYNNPRGRDLAMVRTLALCHNAIAHAKRVLASFSCPTHTMETLQGCSLSIRDGFQPFSLLKVMAWDRLF